jgi:hypothetical protein
MAILVWDQEGKKLYETGTDRGVLYPMSTTTDGYATGVSWNGLQKVTEAPDGAEETALYADNSKYLGLTSAENFKGTIEAYTYPDEFAACDGSGTVVPGVTVGLQTRIPFALVYRTLLGNDAKYNDYGYKLHLVWGAKVSPSERAYETVNSSPSALSFSWKFDTTPVDVPGFKKSSNMVIDSSKVDPAKLKALEDMLYGTTDKEPTMPTPAEVIAMFPTGSGSGTTPAP